MNASKNTSMQFFLCYYKKYSAVGVIMSKKPLPEKENIYNTECPILFAMKLVGQKWKLPILWYIADKKIIRYNELQRKVIGITATMLTKCLKELENDKLVERKQYNTIPPVVEYSLTKNGRSLMPALNNLYNWADKQMQYR